MQNYEQILAHWPVAFTTKTVPTSFGETYVIISGDATAKPLVLLHGGGGNSTMWRSNIEKLSQHFCVYTLDIIGEPGKSAGARPKYMSQDHSLWLKETLTALQLDSPAICGLSLGGFIAQQFALNYPERLNTLILLAPPTLLPMRLSFIFKAMLASIVPTDGFIKYFFKATSVRARTLPDERIWQNITTLWRAYRPNNQKMPVISSHMLKALPDKTLLLLGEDEILFDSQEARAKVQGANPNIQVVILKQAGHTLSFDQPERVNQAIIEFC